MAEPFYITTAISYPNGSRISAMPMRRLRPMRWPAFRRAQGRDVRCHRHRRAWPEDGPDGARAKAATREYADEMSDYFRRCAMI
jgi:methionyl-tRNA synthetase